MQQNFTLLEDIVVVKTQNKNTQPWYFRLTGQQVDTEPS